MRLHISYTVAASYENDGVKINFCSTISCVFLTKGADNQVLCAFLESISPWEPNGFFERRAEIFTKYMGAFLNDLTLHERVMD